MNIEIEDIPSLRFQKDLLYIAKSNMYINEKGYLQKLVDLLYKTGYYNDNESYFTRMKG